MNTPPFLLGAIILFWGWAAGQWLAAIAAALLFEGARWVQRRFAFEPADFNRVADLCSVLTAALAVVLYVQFGNPLAIKLLFQWLPLALAPLAAMQTYSTSPQLDLSVLVWSLRRYPMRRPTRLNLGYSYAAVWLLAASAANPRSLAFTFGMAALVGWALWPLRPRRSSVLAWSAAFAIAAGIGFAGQYGLRELQLWLEAHVPEWLAGGGERTDPYHSRTDIGTLGELKLSGKILMRVDAGRPLERPLLLHRASYDDYVGTTWIARTAAFTPVAAGPAATTWQLAPSGKEATAMTIEERSSADNPVLSLPRGTVRIEELPASGMKRNALGAVQIEIAPGRLHYRAVTGEADPGAPSAGDLRLPPREQPVLQDIANRLGLAGLPDREIVDRLTRFFADGFEYATYRAKPSGPGTPLAQFLLSTHAGHCEYFATATVLLLRAAGVPARYATGFSVQEYSDLERVYVVRQRHAHAWTQGYIGGAWRDIDTTPAQWFAAETGEDSAYSRLADLFSWASYRATRAAASLDREETAWLLAAIALPLLAWFGWRLLRGRTPVVPPNAGAKCSGAPRPGEDSEFYEVEALLARSGAGRGPCESWSEWLARIGERRLLDARLARAALVLHMRYRFDPAGLDGGERDTLARLSRELAAEIERKPH